MLRVITGCWGDRYPRSYIERFTSMVHRNLKQEHRVEIMHAARWPGWWGKIGWLGLPGPCLWIDIDTVITGQLDDLVNPPLNGDIRTAKNWARSGHGGCQSSVMYWHDASRIAELFDEKHVHWPPRNEPGVLWGDQEFITLLRDQGDIEVEYFEPSHVVSYKYHCRGQGLPDDARVVAFHGKPDPHEVNDPWVKHHWA